MTTPTHPEQPTPPDLRAVLVALCAWDRWQQDASRENAVALREAMDSISVHGALAASLGPIIARAREAIA